MSGAVKTRTAKRLTLLAAALLSATPLMAADLTILANNKAKGMSILAEQYQKQTGKVIQIEASDTAAEKFEHAAGKGIDVLCWPNDRIGEFAQKEWIVPVAPSKRILDETDFWGWPPVTFHGKTWAYPLALESIGLIYNKQLVKKVPRDFDEVMALDKTLRGQGKHALLWAYNNSYFSWPIWAGQVGGVFQKRSASEIDPQHPNLNAPAAVRGAELIVRMIKEGYLPQTVDPAKLEATMVKGDVAMIISGPWSWGKLQQGKVDFGVAPLPDFEGKPARPFAAVLGCMLTKSGKSNPIAVDFLENHVLTPAGLHTINEAEPLGTPANKAFFKELEGNELIKATMVNVKFGEPMPNVPEMGAFWKHSISALESITSGKVSAKEGLDEGANRIVTSVSAPK